MLCYNRNIRQPPIQCIDFLIADIADKERRPIRGNTTPGTERTVETIGFLQADDGGKGKIPLAEPVDVGVLNFLSIEDEGFRVAGKSKIPQSANALYGDAPRWHKKNHRSRSGRRNLFRRRDSGRRETTADSKGHQNPAAEQAYGFPG